MDSETRSRFHDLESDEMPKEVSDSLLQKRDVLLNKLNERITARLENGELDRNS